MTCATFIIRRIGNSEQSHNAHTAHTTGGFVSTINNRAGSISLKNFDPNRITSGNGSGNGTQKTTTKTTTLSATIEITKSVHENNT